MKTIKPMRTTIRWMIMRDMPEVLAIEEDSFPHPWREDDFISSLRQRNCIGMVAERDERIAGFMIYELHHTRIHVVNFAVHRCHRRLGVGTAMVDKLKEKLSPQRRTRLMLEIREGNLQAQLFFRSQGFRCISTIREFYHDSDEDALLFEYRKTQE